MSISFFLHRKNLRYVVNMQYCFSSQRKRRLVPDVLNRPWANGLNRLLAERRGLKKGDLAKLADVRPALISAVLSAATPPKVPTLERIAAGFTRYDRQQNLASPPPEVELWEFFVSDEQSAALRERVIKSRTESSDEALLAKAVGMFSEALRQSREPQSAPLPAPSIVQSRRKAR
jgi:transcriptional regulator with XRE-family HTH domain